MTHLFTSIEIPKSLQTGLYIYEFPSEFVPASNWVHRYMAWPRKFAEWIRLIDEFRKPLFEKSVITVQLPPSPTYIPNTVPDVWYHRDIAADQMEALFQRNQWIRWQMRRVFMSFRKRVMDRRIIGALDVGTMEPIPVCKSVQVYDWASRTTYRFHVDTIHRQIVGALHYQVMAMSRPQLPKNPYTNLPWTTGQLLVLFDQIHTCLWNTGRQFMNPAAQAFYKSSLSISRFSTLYGPTLDTDCAQRFFRDPTSEYWDLLYAEGLIDIFTFLTSINKFQLRTLLLDRSLPMELLHAWDDLVYGFWCCDNLNRIVLMNTCSIYDMIDKAQNLLDQTETFLKERKIVRKKNRPPS